MSTAVKRAGFVGRDGKWVDLRPAPSRLEQAEAAWVELFGFAELEARSAEEYVDEKRLQAGLLALGMALVALVLLRGSP